MAINLASDKILVIEDQPIMRETIKHILGLYGARLIVEAESGLNALAAMHNDKFDIVLCDYELSKGKNGQQVLEEAKHLKLLPVNAVFIMVTGEQNSGMVLTAIDNKPDGYLIKPFNQIELVIRIERCQAAKKYLASIENEIDSGNLYQAIYHCERLLQMDDKKMRMSLLKIRAELALKIGDFNTAETIYQDVLLERELPWARLGLGVVAFFLGYYDQAIETFQVLIEQNPSMLEAYDWLVKAHESLGNHEPALSSLNLAVSLSPMSILRQKKLALLADKTENLPIAKKAYMATIKLGKHSIHRSTSDYSGLANIYLKSNAPNEALKILNDLNQQFNNDPEAKLRTALLENEIYRVKGNKVQAQQAYEKTINLNEQYSKQLSRELRLEMAKSFYLNGNSVTCDEILNDLVKTNIDDQLFIKEIVAMCNAVIDENYAKALIQNIKKELIDINNKGVSLFQEGNITGALTVFNQAIAKMPDNHTITLNMIKILLHDLKSTPKLDPKKIITTQSFINKAIEIGIPHNQIDSLQIQLNAISTPNQPITNQ